MIKKLRTVLFLPLVMLQSCGDTEINHQGSDALLEVTTSLAQAYRDAHAGIAISVSGGGSGGGIASLIRGELDIANSNRPLNEKELEAAKKSDVKPIAHIVGYAGIAIFVHKDNPIKSLTIAQLKALFGDGGTANGWSDLGIRVGTSDADDSVVLVSREDSTGAHEYFLDLVLGNDGSFKTRCINQTSAENVVTMCAQSKNAIGYSGLGYATEDVRVVAIVSESGQPAVLPTIETVLDKSYAISGPLYMYTNGEPTSHIKKYLDWIQGADGQKVMLDQGYVPGKPE